MSYYCWFFLEQDKECSHKPVCQVRWWTVVATARGGCTTSDWHSWVHNRTCGLSPAPGRRKLGPFTFLIQDIGFVLEGMGERPGKSAQWRTVSVKCFFLCGVEAKGDTAEWETLPKIPVLSREGGTGLRGLSGEKADNGKSCKIQT